jgi:hypothetical protein
MQLKQTQSGQRVNSCKIYFIAIMDGKEIISNNKSMSFM